MKGCVHIYCGDGKGKTSAALGLAVRAAGRGRKVLLVRFLKNDSSGELAAFLQIPQIEVFPCERSFGFVFNMNAKQKEEASRFFHEYFQNACRQAVSDAVDVVIFDELMAACNYGMVPEAEIVNFLAARPETMEVVMTGRNPTPALMEAADYISEVRMVRHPYQKGVPAREGIEY